MAKQTMIGSGAFNRYGDLVWRMIPSSGGMARVLIYERGHVVWTRRVRDVDAGRIVVVDFARRNSMAA